MTISYTDTESTYYLLINFKQAGFKRIFGNEVEFKYGKKDKLKTVNLANNLFKLPYIAYYILYTLIKSISIFNTNMMKEINDPANINKYPKWKQILISAKDVAFEKTFSKYKEVNIELITVNDNSTLIIEDRIFRYHNKIKIDFTNNQINDQSSMIINLKNMFDGYEYSRSSNQLKLVDICIWLLELDNKKRNVFMKEILPINIDNVPNKEEILILLKNFSKKMKARLDEDKQLLSTTNIRKYFNSR